MSDHSFFSVSFDLISTHSLMTYDLYINASSKEKNQKFLKIFPKGEELSKDELEELKRKYRQLYVSEAQRNIYMKSLVGHDSVGDVDAVNFIKDSAIKYLHKVFDPEKEFSTELLYETIQGSKEALESMIDVLDDYSIDGLRGLIGNLSGHDFYTYDHSINVSMYCIKIFKVLRPEASRVELLHAGMGGLLHDLGKIKIPTQILNKPAGLSKEEYDVIKTHPKIGIALLIDNNDLSFEGLDLKTVGRVVHEHHENWDGTGYPQGLKEKEIHLLARVCAIADFFDAITTKRSYAEVVGLDKAVSIMEKTVDKKIDGRLFKLFAAHIGSSKVKTTKEYKIDDNFDPCMPHSVLPIEEINDMFTKEDFGKIKLIDKNEKKRQTK